MDRGRALFFIHGVFFFFFLFYIREIYAAPRVEICICFVNISFKNSNCLIDISLPYFLSYKTKEDKAKS